MTNEKRCPLCKGNKFYIGAGSMLKECYKCKDVALEEITITDNNIESVVEEPKVEEIAKPKAKRKHRAKKKVVETVSE